MNKNKNPKFRQRLPEKGDEFYKIFHRDTKPMRHRNDRREKSKKDKWKDDQDGYKD